MVAKAPPTGRREAHREQEVEPRLRTVSPVLNAAMWCALFPSIAGARLASAKLHLGMTRHDFAGYRFLLAGSHAASVLLWGCFLALVLKAQALQRARESQPAPS